VGCLVYPAETSYLNGFMKLSINTKKTLSLVKRYLEHRFLKIYIVTSIMNSSKSGLGGITT
jgi:hypothetical protein